MVCTRFQILDNPYEELAAYDDQGQEEGPFWTLLRSDGTPYCFQVISIGLQRNKPTIAVRKRNGMEGAGRTYDGNDVEQYFLKDNFAKLSLLYNGWFSNEKNTK